MTDECCSCGKKINSNHSQVCGECYHTWSKPGLVWHDWKLAIDFWRRRKEYGFRFRFPRPRRLSKIYSCPCCAHDL